MIINSVSDFIDRILQLYPPYRWDEVQEKAWVDIMVREMSSFKPNVLDRGFQELVRRRKDSKIPTPAECIAVCKEAKAWIEAEANRDRLPEFRAIRDEYSTERWRLAHELKRSALGRQAAREGWIVAFVHFARRNQRPPVGPEIDQCRKDSAGIEEIYSRASRGDIGFASREIAKWAGDILEKRRVWSEEALGQ